MLKHVELNRTFWPVNDEADYEPDSIRFYAALGIKSDGWPELLGFKRIVILAEAGMGKTHEFRETTRMALV